MILVKLANMLELLGLIFLVCVSLCWLNKPKQAYRETRFIIREQAIETAYGVEVRRELIVEMPDESQNVLQSRNGSVGSRWIHRG